MAPVLPLRTAWIPDILSQASLRYVERQRCWKRGSGDGQRLWDYFTARLSDLSMPLTSEVRRSPEPSARPSAAADSEERQICTTCLFAESVGLCLCFLPSCAMYRQRCWKRGSGDGQRRTLLNKAVARGAAGAARAAPLFQLFFLFFCRFSQAKKKNKN